MYYETIAFEDICDWLTCVLNSQQRNSACQKCKHSQNYQRI